MSFFVACKTASKIDKIAMGRPETCFCDGTTLKCTDLDGLEISEANHAVCDEVLLNAGGVCQCEGTTLVCDYQMCQIKVPATTCGGMFTGQYITGPCINGFEPLNKNMEYASIPKSIAEFETEFVNSAQCSGAQPSIPITLTPPTSNSGQLPLPPTPAADACADHGGKSFAGEVCVCPGIIDNVVICADGTKFDNPTTQSCTPNETCASGGETGGTCTLTVEQCNAQGFGQVDPATCTCFGNYKP